MSRRRTHRNPVVTIILLLLIAASALIIVKVFVNRQNVAQEQDQTIVVPDTKPAESKQEEVKEEKVTPIQNEGEDPNQLETLTGNLTTNRVSNGKLVLRVNINQYLFAGTCTLTLTSGSNIVTKTANIVAAASTSTCEGFDIPVSELPSGTWQININIKSGDKTGTIMGEQNI